MHLRRSAVRVLVAVLGTTSTAVAQGSTAVPVDSLSFEARRPGRFGMDVAEVLRDTMLITTSIRGNYTYGRNDNGLFRWDNGITLRAQQRIVVRFGTEYGVGVATRDDGSRYMDRRWWKVQGTADLDPSRRLSSFALASVESSFELRIDRRTTAGAGAKLTVYRRKPPVVPDDRAVAKALPAPANRLDVSLAITGEQNLLPRIERIAIPLSPLAENLTRLSGRVRWTQRLGDRWWFDQITWYKPELLALHRFNADLQSRLIYALTRRTFLELSSRHIYEGSASGRGAKNNRTGQLDVGVTMNFGRRGL